MLSVIWTLGSNVKPLMEHHAGDGIGHHPVALFEGAGSLCVVEHQTDAPAIDIDEGVNLAVDEIDPS